MVLNAISSRASVRAYSNKVVDDNTVKLIIEAGIMAPSWVNVQPWHFIVVDNQDKKDLLAEMCLGQKHISQASHAIIMVADSLAFNRARFGKILKEGGKDDLAIDMVFKNQILNPALLGDSTLLLRLMEQTTYALSYMTLEAQNQGLGCCIVGAMMNELTCADINFIQIKYF